MSKGPLQTYIDSLSLSPQMIDQFWDDWEKREIGNDTKYLASVAKCKAAMLAAIIQLYKKKGGRFYNINYHTYRVKMVLPHTRTGYQFYPVSKRECRALGKTLITLSSRDNHTQLFDYQTSIKRWSLNVIDYRTAESASSYVIDLDMLDLFTYHWQQISQVEYEYQKDGCFGPSTAAHSRGNRAR